MCRHQLLVGFILVSKCCLLHLIKLLFYVLKPFWGILRLFNHVVEGRFHLYNFWAHFVYVRCARACWWLLTDEIFMAFLSLSETWPDMCLGLNDCYTREIPLTLHGGIPKVFNWVEHRCHEIQLLLLFFFPYFECSPCSKRGLFIGGLGVHHRAHLRIHHHIYAIGLPGFFQLLLWRVWFPCCWHFVIIDCYVYYFILLTI